MTRDDRFGFSVLSRRRWLELSIGVGVMVAGGFGGSAALRGAAPDVPGLRALTAREFQTLAALARALFPAGGPVPVSADDLALARAFDGFLADEPEWNRADLEKALLLVELGPLLFERRFTTFPRLSPVEALAHFERVWAEGESVLRRQVALAFRKFFALVFYDDERVWPHIGYPGPSLHPIVTTPGA